ncbi:MAG: XkdX family protein [Anaerovorax sp.]|nr:XkdX family protein [Anaerovorax sp.]
MSDFEKCKRVFEISVSKAMIKAWVRAKRITPEEYQEITGEEYTD